MKWLRLLRANGDYKNRLILCEALKKLKTDCYLMTPDGILVWYNYSNSSFTLGDGQALDFHPQPVEDVERFILSHIHSTNSYVDVGSNNGYYYALKVARQYPNCLVFAFEPNSTIFEHLTQNIKANQAVNVHPIKMALSNYFGTGYLSAHTGGMSRLVESPDGSELVAVEVLDNFVRDRTIRKVDAIKIDVEGLELAVLQGAKETLRKDTPALVVEEHGTREQVERFLLEFEYSVELRDGSNSCYVHGDNQQ